MVDGRKSQGDAFRRWTGVIGDNRQGEWANTFAPAFCHFNNTESGAGLLYNFHVVANESEIAPYGWHVATDEDWKILEEFIGMPADELDNTNWRGTTEGDQLKEESTSTTGWFFYDNTVWGNNASGFSAVGGAAEFTMVNGVFQCFDTVGFGGRIHRKTDMVGFAISITKIRHLQIYGQS